MTQLTDYIDQQGADNALNMIRTHDYWWALSLAVKSAKDIKHVVNTMDFQTLPELQAWVQACNTGPMPKRELWQALVNPQCSVKASDLLPCTWPEMDVARDQQCTTAADYKRNNSDRNYLAPTEAQLRVIAQACPSWRYQYGAGESSDCDDAVRIARGWLSSVGLGGLAGGLAGTVHYLNDAMLYGHAVILCFVTRESATAPLKAWWWEPQTGQIHPVSVTDLGNPSPYPWDKPNLAKLAWADF